MGSSVHRLDSLPDPYTDPAQWSDVIRGFPKWWRRVVLSNDLKHERFNHGALSVGDVLATDLDPSNPPAKIATPCPCYECGVMLPSRRGLTGHMTRQHGHRTASRQFVENRFCPVCGRDCYHRDLAIKHLAETKCSAYMAELTPVAADKLAELDLVDAARMTASKRQGRHPHRRPRL